MNPLDWLPLASKYANRYKTWGFPHHTFEDLLQTAMLGVVVACDKYDSERGYTFQACASLYIRKELQDLLFTDPNTKTLRSKEFKLGYAYAALLDGTRDNLEEYDQYANRLFIPDIVEQEVFFDEVVSSLMEGERKFLLDIIDLSSIDAGKVYMQEHGVSRVTMSKRRTKLRETCKDLLLH